MMMGGGLGGMGMPGMGGPGSDEPARKDVLGDGTVFKEVLEAGEQYGRQPEPGDECVVSWTEICLLYTSPSPRDKRQSRMPSSA